MNQIQHEREVVYDDILHKVSKSVTWAFKFNEIDTSDFNKEFLAINFNSQGKTEVLATIFNLHQIKPKYKPKYI